MSAPVTAVVVWGPELSPFLLKLEALLAYAGVPFRRLPRDGGRLENLRTARRIEAATRLKTAERPTGLDPLDEYPLVPFLLTPAGEILYDSSALARWIDARQPPTAGPCFPADPAVAFVAQLVDEAFDEVGLYLVHHNRWVVAARDNDAGRRLADEYRRLRPPGAGMLLARWFSRRQVRRLPYLFSVAPDGFSMPGLPAALTPPSRPGFPATHALLGTIWQRWVDGVEHVLAAGRPYLLGDRFTVADASVYGQLSMNLTDPSAARALEARAPRTYAWLVAIRERRHAGSSGPLALASDLAPLLRAVLAVVPPLLRANARAYATAIVAGERLFNEPAFDRGRALYDGALLGQPFRSVVKTFQVRSWNDLRAAWRALPTEARDALADLVGQRLDVHFGDEPTTAAEAAAGETET